MWTLVAAALWMCGDVEAKRKSPRPKEKSAKSPCPVNWTTPNFRWKWATLRNSTVELHRAVNGSRVYDILTDDMWKACEKDLFKKIPCPRFKKELATRLHQFQTAFTLVRDAFQIEAANTNLTLDKLADLLLDEQMPRNVISTLSPGCRQHLTPTNSSEDNQKVIFQTLLEGFHSAMADLDTTRKRRRGNDGRKRDMSRPRKGDMSRPRKGDKSRPRKGDMSRPKKGDMSRPKKGDISRPRKQQRTATGDLY